MSMINVCDGQGLPDQVLRFLDNKGFPVKNKSKIVKLLKKHGATEDAEVF